MQAIIDFLFNYWTYLVGWTIGILGLVWRYKSWDEKRKEKIIKTEKRFADIESRLKHLDDPETGRVHKISKLSESQIKHTLHAYGLAKEVKGRLEEIRLTLKN